MGLGSNLKNHVPFSEQLSILLCYFESQTIQHITISLQGGKQQFNRFFEQVDWVWPEGSVPKDGDFNITFTVVTNRKHFWVKTAPVSFSADSQL
jgi:hypothetical protein